MANKTFFYIKQNWSLLIASALYIVWALAFIFNSSYVASDGKRYFNLFDDGMISMRYAWNFARGVGLVWNAGERVEGYTNLLMTLLMSVAAFFLEKRYAVFAIQLTGIFFTFATALLSTRIFLQTSKTSENSNTSLLLSTLFPLLYYPLNFWSLMGMETGLLAFLLGAGVYASLLYAEKLEAKYLWTMAVCFGLAHLTRNESLLFAALAFAYLLPTALNTKDTKYTKVNNNKNAFPLSPFVPLCLKRFLLAGVLYSLFVIGQLAFRYFYYGEIVPNTYTLKLVGMAFDDRLKNGWGFIQLFFQETGIIIAIALIGMLFKILKNGTLINADKRRFFFKPSAFSALVGVQIYLCGFFLIAVVYQIYVGGDSWDYWRIMSPTMPFLFVVFLRVVADFFERSRFQSIALIIFSLIGLYFANARFAREFLLLDLPYQNNYARAHTEVAIALNELTDENATIGVFWAGTLPYYLDRPAIDFLGKSDKYIANLSPDMSGQSEGFGMTSIPGHNKHDLTYSIQKLLPTYVEEFDYGTEKLSDWAQSHYVRVKQGETKLYLLKDSPHVKWGKVTTRMQWK